jgi:hypothetical protein
MEEGTWFRVFACINIATTFSKTFSSNIAEFYSPKDFDKFLKSFVARWWMDTLPSTFFEFFNYHLQHVIESKAIDDGQLQLMRNSRWFPIFFLDNQVGLSLMKFCFYIHPCKYKIS